MDHKIYNTIYGAIVGDALGVPVEFYFREDLEKKPVHDMREYGTFNLPKGSWSDDSSMTLCLADSIGRLKKIDYKDIMKCFWNWYRHSKYTPDNRKFDIGRTCSTAIVNYYYKTAPLGCGPKSEQDNGNGSLMRISPLPFYLLKEFGENALDNENAFELIHNISKLTHGHEIALIGCDIYCSIMLEILKGTKSKSDIQGFAMPHIGKFVRNHPEYEYATKKYYRMFHMNFKDIPKNEIKSSGYVVDTLEAAFWSFLNTDSYKDCVLKAVNLGYDTDTVACVAGSIAGLYYGEIPEEWINAIRNRKLIDKIIKAFTEAIGVTC